MRRAIALTVVAYFVLLAVSACAQGIPTQTWEQAGSETFPTASWFGSTGLLVTPTAYVIDPQQVQVQYHHIGSDHGIPAIKVWGGNVGVVPNLELGISHFGDIQTNDVPTPKTVSETVFNGKYHLQLARWLNNPQMPDVAFGMFDISNKINRTWYVVASKQINLVEEKPTSLGAHLGFARNDQRAGKMNGIFGGIDFVPFKGLIAQAEYDSDHINGCVRYYPKPEVSLDLGSVNSNFSYGVTGHIAW